MGDLIGQFDLENDIICGHEKNQWPTPEVKKGWPEYKDYNLYDTSERKYLNSGMILAKKDKYVEMLDIMTEKLMFGKEIKTFKDGEED